MPIGNMPLKKKHIWKKFFKKLHCMRPEAMPKITLEENSCHSDVVGRGRIKFKRFRILNI